MATKLVKCTRIVRYLPTLQTAVMRCRTFSSASDSIDNYAQNLTEDTTKSQTVWPDKLLGPLGPQDKRFPLPGRIGPCVNSRQLNQINTKEVVPSLSELDAILPAAPFQRHIDTTEQFLTSIDEIDVDFVDRDLSIPTSVDRMEYRAHKCPVLLRKEFKDLFPQRNIMEGELTVITISLKTKNDMTTWSSEVEQEREELLEMFIQGAAGICQAFEKAGFWADFIDPSSGKPFNSSHTNFTLFETDERYRKLGFEIHDLGCCKVISHPVWGTHAYIGCMFTSASIDHPLLMNLNSPL